MKIRFYNTPNDWWYFNVEYKKENWLSFNFLGKELSFYWGKNTKYIP